MTEETTVGVRLGQVRIGPVAHGGFCVARHEGRVLFVRHALPGELVDVEVTDDSHANYWRADAVAVLEPSPDRVQAPCPIAGECGGCDFQHVAPAAQRRLKAAVVGEQLRRLAGIEWHGAVEQVAGDDAGLGWRTRMRYLAVDGAVGLRASRTNRLVPLPPPGCLLAHPGGPDPRGFADRAFGSVEIVVAASGASVLVDGALVAGEPLVTERADGREYRVAADGFWQVHPGAARTLVDAVLAGLDPKPGQTGLDLYCGVGLFAGALSARGVRVLGVEMSKGAVSLAQRNVPAARFVAAPVERALGRLPDRTDLIVLDPPRKGAGARVCRHLAGLGAGAISYVACDPAALARDLAALTGAGYEVESVRAFDLFPMTHHVECVATLRKARG